MTPAGRPKIEPNLLFDAGLDLRVRDFKRSRV
jgi:hypothetical protein